MSVGGAPVEAIARLVGHGSTATTEGIYWKELPPVITEGGRKCFSLEAHPGIGRDRPGVRAGARLRPSGRTRLGH